MKLPLVGSNQLWRQHNASAPNVPQRHVTRIVGYTPGCGYDLAPDMLPFVVYLRERARFSTLLVT